MNVPPVSALSSLLSTANMGEFALALSCPSNLCCLLEGSLSRIPHTPVHLSRQPTDILCKAPPWPPNSFTFCC